MSLVVFVAPFPMTTTMRFAQAVTSLRGVRTVGIFTEPPSSAGFDHVIRCPDVLSDAHLGAALDRVVATLGRPDRLLGILEPLQEPLARQRARLGIPGIDPRAAERFRDKAVMKAALTRAGVPVAPSRRCQTAAEVRAFIAKQGFPVVLKPPAGAGAKATVRVDDAASLERVLPSLPAPILAEAFLTGQEHSMETWVVGGRPVFHSVTRYYPTPLEVSENPHLQWIVHLPRDQSPYADVVGVVDHALAALGMDDGIAHTEWFRRPDGSIAIGEIAARPPGAGFMDLHAAAHDADLYKAWARLVVQRAWDGPYRRGWSVAGAYLRGPGEGRVVAIDGLEEAQRRVGVHVLEARLPRQGAPRSSGYEGDGFVILRHQDDEVVKRAAAILVSTIRVRYA